MKTYIEKEPVFSDSIQLTETTDPGNADYMNISTKQIFANTLVNQKEIREGDSKNKIITFDSMDSKKADKWTDVAMMESGEKHKSLIEKISIMFKNVRYLYKLLGTTDISKIEDGTVTGAIKKVNKALKPIDAENRIEEMTSINQITSVGFWKIATIENNYAHEIGIDNNVGDFYAIVSNYNGNGTDRYTFGDLLLFSPRLQGYHYAINIWNENAQARLVLTNDNILTTKEQINANTDLRNIAGATAMKEMFSEINSNLSFNNFPGGTILEYYQKNPKIRGCFCIRPNIPTDLPAIFSETEGYLQFFRDTIGQRVLVVYWNYGGYNIIMRGFYANRWLHDWKMISTNNITN